jgi:hypothetical protein
MTAKIFVKISRTLPFSRIPCKYLRFRAKEFQNFLYCKSFHKNIPFVWVAGKGRRCTYVSSFDPWTN